MTTHWEGQRPIWSISGLAEVLSCGGANSGGDDAIVRFNRDSGDPSSNGLSHAKRRQLDQWGYVVVPGVGTSAAAKQLVRGLGELIPQRNGGVNHDVTLPHTEASGRFVSPAYVAVYCSQHRRGGGQTDLLDVRRLVAALDDDELALMTEVELHFPGPAGGVHSTMLSTDSAGDTVTRFNFELLIADDKPLGEACRKLANRVGDLFRELCTSVLIPDGALLIWDNQRMLHARSEDGDRSRHLTRFVCGDWRRPSAR